MMDPLFSWAEDPAGEDDVFFASTSRSIDEGGFHLTINGPHADELGDWDDTNFASYESFEHLLSTDTEADSDYAHFLQTQNYEVDNLLSPPAKSSSFKKRVSPAKDIQHKRTKQYESKGSWKHRPDHLDVLGSSAGSGGGSLGTTGMHEVLASAGLISPTHTLAALPELSVEASLSMFVGEEIDPHAPLTTSTPMSTPNKAGRRTSPGSGLPHSSGGKNTLLDWSDDEIRLFEEGLVLYGAPNWRQVAALVGTRNTSQVKNFSVKYFNLHGPNVVPHVDPSRMEQLRAEYLPLGSHSSSTLNGTQSNQLSKSQRLKRTSTGFSSSHERSLTASGTVLHSPADKTKLQTPKKAGAYSGSSTPAKSPNSNHHMSPPGSSASSSSSNKGPHNRPAKGPAASYLQTPNRRKADEQLIVLKKTGDEDEDICIEDEEIDIDGDDDGSFLRHAIVAEGDSDDEDHHQQQQQQQQQQQFMRMQHHHDDDHDGDHQALYMGNVGVIGDNLGPSRSSAPNTAMARNNTPQWRQRSDYALDESGDYIAEDSIGFSDADSSTTAMSEIPLNESTSSLSSSTVSVAQALKALGLEGEAWIQDVEIPPTKVLELQEDHVLDLEMQANSEFFEGNNVKTPERYVRIRNHILRTWIMNKQRYVTKTSVRRGLRDCGDVNAIGRVHQFLELVGAINFGLEAPPSCRKQGQPEPLSVLMMSKAPLHNHLSSPIVLPKPRSASSVVPGAPSYATVAAGVQSMQGQYIQGGSPIAAQQYTMTSHSSIRSQFDAQFEVIKNPANVNLPFLVVSSNATLVMDLHAHLHKRDGFGLIAGHFSEQANSVNLRYAIPYTGPQSSSASSFQAVTVWEKSVAAWIETSAISKSCAASGTPLEILGYYTTHKLNGALSVTQFTHYKNVFSKGARNRPFVGIFAVPYERTPDSTLFQSVMYPVGSPVGGIPQKTLYLLKRNVYCEKKLPQEQFAQLFSAYYDNDLALSLTARDERETHRTLLERCLVSLSSAVFVSEREKNALWEHMRVLAAEGVSAKLAAMLNTKDAVWSFRESPTMLAAEQIPAMYYGDPFVGTAQKLDFSGIAAPQDPLGIMEGGLLAKPEDGFPRF